MAVLAVIWYTCPGVCTVATVLYYCKVSGVRPQFLWTLHSIKYTLIRTYQHLVFLSNSTVKVAGILSPRHSFIGTYLIDWK
jgi:hypothetical protein